MTEPRREAAVELFFFFKGFAAVVDAVRAANGAFFFTDGLSASSSLDSPPLQPTVDAVRAHTGRRTAGGRTDRMA